MTNAPARVDQRRDNYQGNYRPERQPPAKIDTLKPDAPRQIRAVPTEEVLYELMAENNWLNLSADQRLAGYKARCDAIGLDPMTFPFEFIEFQAGKVTLYPTRAATDQLRRIYGVSCKITAEGYDKDTQTLWAKAEATFPDGRTDEDIAYLFTYGKAGLDLANMRMKVITKAKRRVTLSAIGLGQMAEASDDYDEGRYIKKHDLDLSTGKIAAGEVRAPVDIYRKLHWRMGQRVPGQEPHSLLRSVAASLFDQFGSLKLIGDDRMHRLYVFVDEAPDDELTAAIDAGTEILSKRKAGDALESRRTNETAVNEESVADEPNNASDETTDATDAEFAEVDEMEVAMQQADADGIDEGAGPYDDPDDVPFVDQATGEINAAESRVLDFLAVIDEARTKRDLDRISADVATAGVTDARIVSALDAKYDKAKAAAAAARPAKEATPAQASFTATGAPGDDRFTNS